MSKNLNLLSFLFLWICFFNTVLVFSQTPKVSPGVVISEENYQILYEGTAAIIYTFKVPQWSDFLILDLDLENCQDSHSTDNSTSTFTPTPYCKILTLFRNISEEIQSLFSSLAFNSFPEETRTSTWDLKCHYLGQHFSSGRVDISVIQKYLGYLRSCLKDLLLEEELDLEPSSKPTLTFFDLAYDTFSSEFQDRFDPTGDKFLQNAAILNFISGLLTTGFSTFMGQASRWNSGVSKCLSGFLPDSLIGPAKLQESLLKLELGSEWKFSISPELEFLPLYYKNRDLADCTFSGDVFYIRLLVPMIRSSRDWKHISAQRIPFYYQNLKEGHGQDGDGDGQAPQALIYETDGDFNEYANEFYYETRSRKLCKITDKVSSSCTGGGLNQPGFCRLPEFWKCPSAKGHSCVWSLLQNDTNLDSCEGRISGEFESIQPPLPIVLRHGTDTFYMTGLPESAFTVKCTEPNGSETITDFQFPRQKGALEVKLPCFCRIVVNEFIDFEADAPCQYFSDRLTVTEIWHRDFIK